ncbi:MAG: hypothetical protein J4A00_11065 [Gammaproteobacteria bacterium]|nr:hypothetical protein [Gammaproteobacteria bacterium]
MGLFVDRDHFSEPERQLFSQRVRDNLSALRRLLNRPGFGHGAPSFGAELEMYIIDQAGSVAPINEQIIAACGDSQLQPELNRFNLEYNLSAVKAAGHPFQAIETEINQAMERLDQAASEHQARVVPIGILPTLREADLSAEAMTDIPRYRALSRELLALRDGPFQIEIDGLDPLSLTSDNVTPEGANTSFQVHWRINPERFASTFNAVQMLTPLALAIGANSPTLLGHRLWDETRIALFKQSIDYRHPLDGSWRLPSRIPFGFGWVRSGAFELFAETCALFPPLLPIVGTEESLAVVQEGGIPRLEELRLHHGTVWPWNRAIYDDADGGHLRIEMRALPAGPTPRDMIANAALLIGAAETLQHQMAHLLPALPYHYAEYNFYRAAKQGLAASLIWPRADQTTLEETPVKQLIQALLPMARDGLGALGVADDEINRVLAPIHDRLASGVTGARWQRRMFEHLLQSGDRPEARVRLLENYIRELQSGRTVADWSDTL